MIKLESKRIKIKKIEKYKKKGKLVPTYSFKLYAESEKLLRDVTIFGIPRAVDVYLRYGHRLNACKSEQ